MTIEYDKTEEFIRNLAPFPPVWKKQETGNDLKDCPFCDKHPYLHIRTVGNQEVYYVGCINQDCLIKPRTAEYIDANPPREAWNTRP